MAGNIYILWKELKNDPYLDIIELVRDRTPQAKKALENLDRASFSEVFLFFDYDSHQNNLGATDDANEILLGMFETFDNETENGKLYVSYPMAEAIRDLIIGSCYTYSGPCFYKRVGKEYKTYSGENNPLSHISSYTVNKWGDFINAYIGRLSCLSNSKSLLSIRECKALPPIQIHQMQKNNADVSGLGVEVLSAFPKFLIDYFREDYLKDFLLPRSFNYPSCNSNEKATRMLPE